MTAYTPWRIAHVCHEANRALQVVNGDLCPSLRWSDEPEEVHRFAVAAVEFALRGGTPEEQFRNWRDAKAAEGWTYGPIKDRAAKTHPCMVADYADLPEAQRVKDAVFASIVRAMSGAENRPVPGSGELIAFGLAMEEAQRAVAGALLRTEAAEAAKEAAETELAALASSLGTLVAAAAAVERERADAAEAKAAKYENAINWNTSCTSCAAVLDSSIAETNRREQAEAEAARLRALLTRRGRSGEAQEYLEPREAARILGVAVTAVAAWAEQGKLTAVRRGRNRRYLATSVEALRRERAGVKTAQNGKGPDA